MGDIAEYIEKDIPRAARAVLAGLRAKARQLAHIPYAFPVVARFTRYEIRRRAVGNYLIFYRVTADTVFVLGIVHGARDIEALLAHGTLR